MDNFLTLINYSSWALHFLVFFPIVGMLLVLAADEAKAKHIALGIALIEFVVSIPLWTGFSPATAAFQFGKVGAWIPDWGIGYRVGVDGISEIGRASCRVSVQKTGWTGNKKILNNTKDVYI